MGTKPNRVRVRNIRDAIFAATQPAFARPAFERHASSLSRHGRDIRRSPRRARRATKSVATEYYRPNIEDCGEPVPCLNKRRIFTQIWTSVGLRRATDEHMQNGHDCESEFRSTIENGRERWASAWPAIRAATSSSAPSSVGGPT